MKKSDFILLVQAYRLEVLALKNQVAAREVLFSTEELTQLKQRVAQLESEKDNAQAAIATLQQRVQELEARQIIGVPLQNPAPYPWWQPPYIVTCTGSDPARPAGDATITWTASCVPGWLRRAVDADKAAADV